jgi:tetratricopeptide (TPR) repeat protein
MYHIIVATPMLVLLASQNVAHPTRAERQSYEAAKVAAGNSPAKLVKLALWCEAHGMRDEQRAVLDEAVRLDPNNKSARGLLGQVSYQRRWETPEAVSQHVKDDDALAAKIAEYNARRERIDRDTEIERQQVDNFERIGHYAKAGEVKLRLDRRIAPEHVRLGLWCEVNGLKPQALAHFTTALELDPHKEATWKHMGYIKHHGRWMSHEQISAEEHEAQAQKHADRHWGPLLHKWAAELGVRPRRAEAEANMAKVSDPRAVPSIIRLFGESSPIGQMLAVRLLQQIDAPAATAALAILAVESGEIEVRQAAIPALKGREPRDYGESMINLIHTPVTYQVQPVAGPGSRGALVIDSPRFRIARTYEAPAAFRLSGSFYGYAGYDANGLPVVIRGRDMKNLQGKNAGQFVHDAEARTAQMLADAQNNAVIAAERLGADVRELEEWNAQAKVVNQRVEDVFRVALDAPASLGAGDEDAWHAWYYERIGYRYMPPPKVVAAVNAVPDLATPKIISCFAAGTPVRTLAGPRPIESIRTGDQVLSRDVITGSLDFRPVLAVHHNPPDTTLRVALDNGDAVVASRFHRFWLAGRGWAMARDLKSGEVLRTLGGPARITSVELAPVQPVFNLDVGQSRTYFVGSSAMLVHDNTLPPAHPVELPFDHIADSSERRQ